MDSNNEPHFPMCRYDRASECDAWFILLGAGAKENMVSAYLPCDYCVIWRQMEQKIPFISIGTLEKEVLNDLSKHREDQPVYRPGYRLPTNFSRRRAAESLEKKFLVKTYHTPMDHPKKSKKEITGIMMARLSPLGQLVAQAIRKNPAQMRFCVKDLGDYPGGAMEPQQIVGVYLGILRREQRRQVSLLKEIRGPVGYELLRQVSRLFLDEIDKVKQCLKRVGFTNLLPPTETQIDCEWGKEKQQSPIVPDADVTIVESVAEAFENPILNPKRGEPPDESYKREAHRASLT